MKKIVKQIIYRKFAKVLARVLPYSWYLKLMLGSVEVQGNVYAEKRILCLPKPLFEKDFEQLSYRLREYGWIWFEKHMFKACLESAVPAYARGQKKYADFLDDPNVRWDKVIEQARKLIRALKDDYGVVCLVTVNIDYYQDYAFKLACKKEGVPIVVLQKEYPIHAKEAEIFTKHYLGWNPLCDVVAVAGEYGQMSLEEAGIQQHSKIAVTGFPRLDRYRSMDTVASLPKPKITILSFRSGYGEDSEAVFFNLVNHILDRIGQLTPLLVKAKNSTDNRIISANLDLKIKKMAEAQFMVSHDIPLYDAFAFSTVVVGYNSLSVVEALLTRAHILIPSYVSSEIGILTEVQCQGCAVTFCQTQEELLAKIDEASEGRLRPLTQQELAARKQVFASYWKWDEAVSASERFGEVLESVLKK